MKASLPRRTFLEYSLAGAAGALAGPLVLKRAFAQSASVPANDALTTYQVGPQIWVRWANDVLTSYRAHRSQKYPYMYPLAGPLSGLSLTTETALPWPHHRSLLFACDRVNGGNFWQEGFEAGQILSDGPTLGAGGPQAAEILDACQWHKPDGPVVCRDQRKITVGVPHQRLRLVDWEIRWTAVEDVTVAKTNHSLFALRAAGDIAPAGGGTLVDSAGREGEKATFGQPAAWCAFFGKRKNLPGELVEGIAILDHPANPWAPTPWFTRDYGFISPTPMNFLEKPWTLPAGESVALRYRVVLFAGDPRRAGLDAIHKRWVGG